MSYTIRNPKNEQEISRIFDLLEIVFPNLKKSYYIKRILGDQGYKRSHSYILLKNDVIASHVHTFHKKIWFKETILNFVGIGAVATSPDFRSKGYASRIMEHVINKSNCPIIGLFTKIPDYYEKFEFSIIPRKRTVVKKNFQ